MKTTLQYRHNGTLYRKVFPHQVSYGTIERFLIMEKHIGLSAIPRAIVKIENQLGTGFAIGNMTKFAD
jgi:hypothetical protein